MAALLAVLGIVFIAMNGRNDGAIIAAVPLQTARKLHLSPIVFLWLSIPLVPFLGMWNVAESLERMMGLGSSPTLEASVVLGASLLIIGAATWGRIPTSITLALVGALTGASMAQYGSIDAALLGRVIGLGIAAPLVAATAAFLLAFVPLAPPTSTPPYRFLSRLQSAAFGAIVFAYAANDGQKVLFATSLVLGIPVGEAAGKLWVGLLASAIFVCGTIVGLPSSGRFVRHGITTITPVDLLWVETSTAVTVLVGSALGTPLSLTQAMTGGLLGVGIQRSRRAVYWGGIVRVCIAWVWTLPASAALAYALLKLTELFF